MDNDVNKVDVLIDLPKVMYDNMKHVSLLHVAQKLNCL